MKQLEIGTKYYRFGNPDRVRTIGGYIYYGDDLWYIVVDSKGNQEDEHEIDVHDWVERYGRA